MDPATAQNEPILALLVVVCLFAVALWAARRRHRIRIRRKHRTALEALAASRASRQGAPAPPVPGEPVARFVSRGDPSLASPASPAAERGPLPPSSPAREASSAEPAPPSRPATAAAVAPLPPGPRYRGLERSREQLTGRLEAMFAGGRRILDAASLQACEEVLLTSDVGVAQTQKLLEALTEAAEAAGEPLDAADVRALLRAKLLEALAPHRPPQAAGTLGAPIAGKTPLVWLFVGVNGVGKTTTIGKLAAALGQAGRKVVLGAGDTYRAAAAEQLGVWAERSQARLVRGAAGADPASVAFNALEAAKADEADIVLLDTAGRLHTQEDLMQEIRKVQRALNKKREGAPDETWLVVDATTGQNALHQAKAFHEALGLTGIVLTKLDGSAKGGIVIAIADALGVPVRFVGLGEQAHDLQPFDAHAFVDALV